VCTFKTYKVLKFRSAVPQLGDGDADAFRQKCSTTDNPANGDLPAINSVPGEKRYNCSLCGYSTDRNGHFLRHVKTHSDLKPYQCETCGKSYKLKTYLKKHRCAGLKTNPNETSQNILEKLLGTASSLDMTPDAGNVLATSSDTQHTCACGAVFESVNDLTSHICPSFINDL